MRSGEPFRLDPNAPMLHLPGRAGREAGSGPCPDGPRQPPTEAPTGGPDVPTSAETADS